MSNKLEPIHDHMLNHVSDAIIFLDHEGKIVSGNKHAYRFLNIAKETT